MSFWLQFTFTGDPVNVAELVTTAAVTLVGAINIGTLLTAGGAFALIQICMGPQIVFTNSATVIDYQNINLAPAKNK